jgi:hypothetical protein
VPFFASLSGVLGGGIRLPAARPPSPRTVYSVAATVPPLRTQRQALRGTLRRAPLLSQAR